MSFLIISHNSRTLLSCKFVLNAIKLPKDEKRKFYTEEYLELTEFRERRKDLLSSISDREIFKQDLKSLNQTQLTSKQTLEFIHIARENDDKVYMDELIDTLFTYDCVRFSDFFRRHLLKTYLSICYDQDLTRRASQLFDISLKENSLNRSYIRRLYLALLFKQELYNEILEAYSKVNRYKHEDFVNIVTTLYKMNTDESLEKAYSILDIYRNLYETSFLRCELIVALFAIERQQYQRAIQQLRQLLDSDPNSMTLNLLIFALLKNGEIVEALKMLKLCTKSHIRKYLKPLELNNQVLKYLSTMIKDLNNSEIQEDLKKTEKTLINFAKFSDQSLSKVIIKPISSSNLGLNNESKLIELSALNVKSAQQKKWCDEMIKIMFLPDPKEYKSMI